MPRNARNRLARTHIGLVLGCLGSALCVLAVAFALRLHDLQTAANVAQLLSIGLALVPIMVPLINWWRRERQPQVVTPVDLAAAREQLALMLLDQWRAESRVRALDDPDPIPVRWRLTEHARLMDVPDNRTAGVLTVASSADVAALIEEFRRLRRRRLVILGDAGAGKTTLAVQILLQLLSDRSQRPDDPVPVLFPLAGWRADADGANLRDWMIERIIAGYPDLDTAGYDESVVSALVAQGHILPILDGLDEATPEVRETFMRAVHASLDGGTQLILTSRTDEFSAVVTGGRVLSSAVVIQPDPLTPHAAADYVRRCLGPAPGPTWQEILRRLSDPTGPRGAAGALSEVASNPLGLWLIRAAYISPGAEPSALLDDERFATPTALRAHLFDRLVAASIAARPPSSDPRQLFRPRHVYDPAQAEGWLRFLAQNLDAWRTREFDWANDTAYLTAPFRWSVPTAALLRRLLPVLDVLPERYARSRRSIQLAIPLAIFVIFFATVLVSSVGALIVLVLIGGAALYFRTILLRVAYSDHGDTDWDAALNEEWRTVRGFLAPTAPRVLFALGYGALTGGITALLTELLLHNGSGLPAGLVVAATGTILAFASYDKKLPPGSRGRSPWYGIGPGPGLRSGIIWGLIIGIPAAVLLTAANADTAGGDMIWIFLAFTVAVSCALLVLVHAVIVPVSYTLAALCAAGVRLAFFRQSSGDGHDDSLALSRAERAGQILRFCRVAIVTALIALAVGIACGLIRDSAAVDGLEARINDVSLTWSGQLRYAIGVAIAWAVTVFRSRLHRGWRSWGIWFLIFALVVGLWPSGLTPDRFRLHLTVRSEGSHAAFNLDGFARLADHVGSGHAGKTVDTTDVLTNSSFLGPVLFWLGVLGLFVAGTLYGRIERGYSRVWWINWLTTRGHVAKGRLPNDLMVFLDDAHRLGLLRAVGRIYQFRHAEFQDHLARSHAGGAGRNPAR